MLITKVELEDIKSHQHFSQEFQAGTTAIVGKNGAGKTSIIEGIAWALFDFLDYNRDDFVRRGAKKGVVRVTFQSGKDNRFYTVIRETGGKHRVFDEELKTYAVEHNSNVMAFLREHLQVEAGTNLKELYRAAIGVPQGTFTAVFLDNATTRKAVFDRLLKVEEYREGAKKLGETANLIKEKRQAVEIRLKVAENDLANFEPTQKEHQQILREIADLNQNLSDLQNEIERRAVSVVGFETARQRFETAQIVLREAQNKLANQRLQQQNAKQNRDQAEKAQARLRIVEPDFLVYVQAETDLQSLELERRERDHLRDKKNQIERELIDHKAREQFLRENLKKAVAAKSLADELAPQIVEQTRLENEYKTLLNNRADLQAAARQTAELKPQVDAKRKEYKDLSEQIKDGETGRDAAAQIETKTAERKQIEQKLNETARAVTSLELLKPQARSLNQELEKIETNIERATGEIAQLDKFAVQAQRVNFLHEAEIELREKIANLRARIELDQKFQREVKNGVCPILPDKCLNLRESQNLNQHFAKQSSQNSTVLLDFESEQKGVSAELKNAREAEKNAAKLTTLREQLANLQKQRDERQTNLDRVRGEIRALSNFTLEQQKELTVEKQKIELELQILQKSAQKYAALEGLRARIADLKQEGKRLADEAQRLGEIAAKLPEIETQIEQNQRLLRELDNPTARAEGCRREAAREPEFQQNLIEVSAKIENFDRDKQNFEKLLTKFAALDEKIAAANAELKRAKPMRDEFLQNQPLAEKLPQLNEELARLTVEVENLIGEQTARQTELDGARADYSEENHRQEKSALDAARSNEAAARATLQQKLARQSQLETQLERLKTVREQLEQDLSEQTRLQRVHETTDYIRETLKQAAPHVGEILRFEIAKEASVLFREVTGDAARSLKWTSDYEIVLDENGYQRPFANLSGGEQMAAALSIRLTLLTQLSDLRIAFFDEPTTNLDHERRENLARQIGQIRNFKQLFVISHDDTFESNVDNQIKIGASSAS